MNAPFPFPSIFFCIFLNIQCIAVNFLIVIFVQISQYVVIQLSSIRLKADLPRIMRYRVSTLLSLFVRWTPNPLWCHCRSQSSKSSFPDYTIFIANNLFPYCFSLSILILDWKEGWKHLWILTLNLYTLSHLCF